MIYRFAAFQLDTSRFELCKDSVPVPVEPQVFSILQMLIENRDRMVTKSELMDVVWNGRVVSESAVSSRIRSARQALEDNGTSQRIIQTVHGKGLRFIADVTETTPSSPPEPATPEGSATPGRAEQPAQARDRPSIAVLPFENLTPNPEDTYFAAGLTEDVITNLSRFRDLFVFSRLTTTALASDRLGIRDIRRQLGTDFIIEGSVRKSADRVRVTVKLVDAVSEGTVLVERLEDACTLENIFDIQDRIALLIAGRIANRRHLLGEPAQADAHQARATKWGTYRWITQYYEYMRTRDAGLHADVRIGLAKALTDDPGSSDGAAALAVILLDEFRFGLNRRPGHPVLEEAHVYAKKAIASDRDNAFAHQALAMVQFHLREFDSFLEAAARSLALNPGRADALAAFGCCYYLAGQFDQALPLLDQAMELNPLENGTPRLVRAGCHFVEGRYQAALHDIKQTDLPGLAWYHAYLVAITHASGDDVTALAQAQLILDEFPEFVAQVDTLRDVLSVCDEVHEKFSAAWGEVFALLAEGASDRQRGLG